MLAGVGQVVRPPDPSVSLTERDEPAALMAGAIEAAVADCGPRRAGDRLLRQAQSLRVMVPLSWNYANPGLLVAERLGITPPEQALSVIGGNSPQTVAAATAQSIAKGDLDVALVTGAECIYTRVAARRHPDRPVLPWTTQPHGTPAPTLLGVARDPVTDTEKARGLDRPLRVFPLFATALRGASGEAPAIHQGAVAALWSRFSDVAATNPYAWTRRRVTADELLTVSPGNRMISYPYPKLMNANDRVDMGAALVLCSLEAARSAGVPDDRLVFPWSAADAHDHWFLSHRADLYSSPAIRLNTQAALGSAGVGLDDVAHLDLYSCFPCAVQIATREIGLPADDPSRPLTVTGGLGFAGGPGNNYVGHSLAAMAGRLRDDPGALGLVTGLGWYMTKHAAGLWSSAPPSRPFRLLSPQAEVDALPQRTPSADADGKVTVEAYTVVHDRDGRPELGIVSLLTSDGHRAWGNVRDLDTLTGLMAEEGCGRSARLHADGRVDIR